MNIRSCSYYCFNRFWIRFPISCFGVDRYNRSPINLKAGSGYYPQEKSDLNPTVKKTESGSDRQEKPNLDLNKILIRIHNPDL